MVVGDLTIWQMLGLGALWACGTAFLVSRALLRVQRLIADEVKTYLGASLADHHSSATHAVGVDLQQKLDAVQSELQRALLNVTKAEDAQEVAEVEARNKTDFLSRMSHEIRTPINGITGSLALIEGENLPPDQGQDLERAVKSCDRLLSIVDEILDLAAVEGGQAAFKREPFDLLAVCRQTLDSFKPTAEDKGLELVLEAPASMSLSRLGDEQKIHQVLSNLISNAVKYTDSGQVLLKGAEVGPDGVALTVQDSGPGISKDLQQRLFEPFSVGDSAASGSGLGLPICKGFVEGMGGRLRLVSTPGAGSIFSVDLELPVSPFRQAEQDNIEAAELSTAIEAEGYAVRVLSVDDDQVNRTVALRHLQKLGCRVKSARNGAEAVEMFTEGDFDMILMDLLMPGMDGFQAAREIRAIEATHDLPPTHIVALTASVVGKVEQEFLEAGMNSFLTKPFTPGDLEAELDQANPYVII